MNEPSIRNVALLPVVAVLVGGVFALSTVVGQNAPGVQDCGPGTHSMAMGESGMAGMDHGSSSGGGQAMGGMDMAGMDHSAHMAMGGGSGGECMGDETMQTNDTSDTGTARDQAPDAAEPRTSPKKDPMPAMDHTPKNSQRHPSARHESHSAR